MNEILHIKERKVRVSSYITNYSYQIAELEKSPQEHPCSLHEQHTGACSQTVPSGSPLLLLLLQADINIHKVLQS